MDLIPWFPGDSAGHAHPASLSGFKSLAMSQSQHGTGAYNQWVFDDSPGESRTGLQHHAGGHDGTAELVCRALRMAIGQRQPQAGLLLHSDRGSQYASHEYQALLMQHGIVCSMSRKGNCWDNAVMERFFLNLKMERVWQREYANQLEANKDITDYIVGFYNSIRRHSALGNVAPLAFEQQFAVKQPIEVSEIT